MYPEFANSPSTSVAAIIFINTLKSLHFDLLYSLMSNISISSSLYLSLILSIMNTNHMSGRYTFGHIWMLVRICSRFLIPIATTLIVCLDYCGIFIISPAFNYPFIFYLNCYLGPYLQYLILYNYFLTVLTNPGYTITHNNSSIETGNSIETVVCKKCQIIKPLRAHHCSLDAIYAWITTVHLSITGFDSTYLILQ
jgi:hypothetical protein